MQPQPMPSMQRLEDLYRNVRKAPLTADDHAILHQHAQALAADLQELEQRRAADAEAAEKAKAAAQADKVIPGPGAKKAEGAK